MGDNPLAGDVLKEGEGDILLKGDSLPAEELVEEEILTPGTPANEGLNTPVATLTVENKGGFAGYDSSYGYYELDDQGIHLKAKLSGQMSKRMLVKPFQWKD